MVQSCFPTCGVPPQPSSRARGSQPSLTRSLSFTSGPRLSDLLLSRLLLPRVSSFCRHCCSLSFVRQCAKRPENPAPTLPSRTSISPQLLLPLIFPESQPNPLISPSVPNQTPRQYAISVTPPPYKRHHRVCLSLLIPSPQLTLP